MQRIAFHLYEPSAMRTLAGAAICDLLSDNSCSDSSNLKFRLENRLFFLELGGSAVVDVDVELSMNAISRTGFLGRNQRLRCCVSGRAPSREPTCRVALYDGGGARPSRHMTVWTRGRRVAMLAAVMPMPGSTVDHIETSITTSGPWMSMERVDVMDPTYTRIRDRW